MKKIDLSSRYNDVLTELEFISDNRGIITSNGNYIRVITSEEGQITAVDYEGGPMIGIEDILEGHKIKSIKNVQLIEFEE